MHRAGRVVLSGSVQKSLRSGRRCESAQPGPSSSGGGFGKALAFTVAAAGAGVAGATAYASYDPVFRRSLEESVPGADYFLESVLGKSAIVYKPADQPTPKPITPKPKKVEKKPTEKELKEAEERAKDEAMHQNIIEMETDVARAHRELEETLSQFISTAEHATKEAVNKKNEVVTAINRHVKEIRKALEEDKTEHWNLAETAAQDRHALEKLAEEVEEHARKQLAQLKSHILKAKSDTRTKASTLLINAEETAHQLEHRIEDGLASVKAATMESKIVAEFKHLVEKGREEFARELASFHPHIKPGQLGDKMSEDELNALIAHAHLKVDKLKQQLTEQQLRESNNIDAARRRQREEDERAASSKLERELTRLTSGSDAAWQRKLAEEKEKFEDDLRAQLRRSAAAHSEHLEEVLRVQQEKFAAVKESAVNDAVLAERQAFHAEIAASLARLQGIEAALEARSVQDAENRRSKELWLACQNLLDSVLHGRKTALDMDKRRKPLANELIAIREASEADAFVNTVMQTLNDEALFEGVYTEEDLKARFNKVRKLCRRVSLIGDDGGSLWTYFFSYFQALLSLDLRKTYSKDETVDMESLDTYDLLARARYFLCEEEDFATALKFLNLLKGEPGRVSADFVRDCRLHLETKLAAQLLLSHASAISLRSLY